MLKKIESNFHQQNAVPNENQDVDIH